MRTKTLLRPKVNIITLGCSKNLVDSEVLMGQLQHNNFDVRHEGVRQGASHREEVVIINTCGFIAGAKEESINTILEYSQLKDQGKVDTLIVTGCLSQRYKPELEVEIPNVDAYFGTTDLPRLLAFLKADYRHELIGERLLSTPNHYAFLKIAEGCDRPCSFCAIPIMRGMNKSRSLESLELEVQSLASRGVKELILIAQDLTSYGIDLYRARALSTLLEKLCAIKGIEWIRLQYAYPSQFPKDVLDSMMRFDQICKYLDMPLQHISDPMLKSMRRGITKRRTFELLDEIRNRVPGIALRTTLICGYPGETEAEFEELKNFVETQRFDRLGVFTYSHEEQTHAYSLADDVPNEVKEARAEEIMAIQQEISLAHNLERVGNNYKVLVDRKEGQYYVGRTEFDSPEVDNEVLIDASEHFLRTGEFYTLHIDSCEDFDLYASPVMVPEAVGIQVL